MIQITRPRTGLYDSIMATNPHHGLKEKLKALTLFNEQQKPDLCKNKSFNPDQESRFTTNPSVDLLCSGSSRVEKETQESKTILSNAMREYNNALLKVSTVTRSYVAEDLKENVAGTNGGDSLVGFSYTTKRTSASSTAARKLSMGSLVKPTTEPGVITRNVKENVQGLQTIPEKVSKGGCGDDIGRRVLVFVRVRPISKKEREARARCCVKIVDRKDVYLTEFASENDYVRLKRLKGRHFTFDASFPERATQHDVYSTTTSDLVEAVLQGRNGSVFCYGATGAGKTYTMLGTIENPGVMVLAFKDLFSKIRQRSFDGNHAVHLSYLEVYNETVRDLLSPGRPLVLREDKQGIVAVGLTQRSACSTDEVMALLQHGNHNRTTEPTRVNKTSSRSHAILQVIVEYCVKDRSNTVVNRVGKLSLVDLAGSEKALATDHRTLRSLEGANINRSLLALSSCINALVEGKKHIPYRNSKLTQLLKDSLGGACNTVMIANISPSNLSFGETQNTLHWADRAKEIRTKAYDAHEEMQIPDSETDQIKLLLELQKENRELRTRLAHQQQKLITIQAQALAANFSQTPSTVFSILSPVQSSAQQSKKRRARPSFFNGKCSSPGSKKSVADETVVELKKVVKGLEAEIERLKKDQLKQKDGRICELSRKSSVKPGGAQVGAKRITTRASLRPKEAHDVDLKSQSHCFQSPAPSAKKRSFWDINAANSPSVVAPNRRKTRSHVSTETAAAPSKLLNVY